MSGAFETAAGAFAVVGVADVVVRTGKELYHFLSDVSNAPDELTQLNASIKDTILLVEALGKRKSTAGSVDAGIVASVQSSVKSLNRELQSLKTILAKFKGAQTAWGRIKYVLDEKKTKKSLDNMERAKLLLVNALQLIYGELIASRLQNTSTLMTDVDTKVKSLHTLVTDLRVTCHSVDAKIDKQEQSILDKQDARQNTLQGQLDGHQKKNQRGISKLANGQAKISVRQESLLSSSKRIETKVQRAHRSSGQDHRKTHTLVTNGFESLHTALVNSQLRPQKSGNKVYFHGQDVNMVMADLLPVQKELDNAVDQVLRQHQSTIPVKDLFSLRDEFRRLLGSAAQETAARYQGSTATSFDDWIVPLLDLAASSSEYGPMKHYVQHQNENVSMYGLKPKRESSSAKHRRMRTLAIETASGTFQLFLSPCGRNTVTSAAHCGFSFASNASLSTLLDIRFTQSFSHVSNPCIHAHLNLFIQSDDSILEFDNCAEFFENTTVEQFDLAVRKGKVSPYHLTSYDANAVLFFSVLACRIDLLQYLENHGIGIRALRHDKSILAAFCLLYPQLDGGVYMRSRSKGDTWPTLEYVLNAVEDPANLLANMIIYYMIKLSDLHADHNTILFCLNTCLWKLHEEGYDCAEYEVGRPQLKRGLERGRETLCSLMELLMEAGADISGISIWGRGPITQLIRSGDSSNLPWMVKDMLFAIVHMGADIHDIDSQGMTCSMSARYWDSWLLWCQVLQDNDKQIEEVLREERNEWLLENDWKDMWFDHTGRHIDEYEVLNYRRPEQRGERGWERG